MMLRKTLICLFAAGLLLSSSAYSQYIRTYGNEIRERPYTNILRGVDRFSLPEPQIPLLHEFSFGDKDFDAEDIQLSAIAVMPGGIPEDVTPGPRLGPQRNVEDGNILIGIEDNPTDTPIIVEFSPFREFVARHVPLTRPTSNRFRIRGGGCRGSCEVELPKKPENSEFAIVGFLMAYTRGSRQHESDQIGIVEQDGIVQIGINDKNNDDEFRYVLDYTWVSRDDRMVVVREHKEEVRKCAAPLIPIPETNSLRAISGFLVDYVEDDHDIQQFRITFGTETDYLDNRIEDTLHLSYRDKNCDDDKDLWVRWLEIGPSTFTAANPTGEITIK